MAILSIEQPTFNLGGVQEPSGEQLAAMQQGQYIYHARDGKLSKVDVEKVLLPHEPKGHPQNVYLVKAPDGTVYVQQETIMCKSTDGGRTWDGYDMGLPPSNARFHILDDGTFITIHHDGKDVQEDPGRLYVWASDDEGRTARIVHEVANPAHLPERHGGPIAVLADGTLASAIESRAVLGHDPTYVHLSRDQGKTWEGPTGMNSGAHFLGGKCYETMICPMPSGKLQAVIRYHGPLVPVWPSYPKGKAVSYKTVFLSDSFDGGVTWQNLRPLTNLHGQCHGHGLALEDGTVILTHDHRYVPGTPCGRAMISRDEGATWQDEVYYLYFGVEYSGFSQSVQLDDGAILTAGGTTDQPETETWVSFKDHTDCWAIRWQPVE